jgi:hypothetical protein
LRNSYYLSVWQFVLIGKFGAGKFSVFTRFIYGSFGDNSAWRDENISSRNITTVWGGKKCVVKIEIETEVEEIWGGRI